MNFLCPACRTPLPRVNPQHATCTGCGVAVDLTRVDTAPGQARLWPEIDLSGEKLSGYGLEKLLGSGGMGSVYEARSPDGTLVALKVLSPLLAAEPALRERFRREARALSALSHPGIVKMLAEGEENGFCWYAMERVHGLDLRERLKSGPLPAAEVVALANVMLDALEVVHASGFIHRDVKPSNILLSPEGPKLCDFGIARVEGASTLTESAALLGSLRYMAPEQRWGKSDARSDLYALGVVLHEALALGVPGERTLPPSTPSALTRLIAKLTETSAVLRPQSAREAKRLVGARAKQPLALVASAIALAGLVSIAGLLWSQRPLVEPSPFDAGIAVLAEVVDAGVPPPLALAAEPVVDAGAAVDAEPDAGEPLLALLRGSTGTGLSTAPPPKGTLLLGTKGKKPRVDLGTLGTASPKPAAKSKIIAADSLGTDPPAKPPSKKPSPSPAPLGTVVVNGGPGVVADGKRTLGTAPGTFDLALGGHAVSVVCDADGQRQMFKVMLSESSPAKTLNVDCKSK